MRRANQVYYFHNDHLGSASTTTDASRTAIHQARTFPFGAQRWSTGSDPTDFDFTGQRRDSFGLLDYNARYYDPAIGRFISADTIVPDFANPQALNRYSYVYNNPLRFSDPSGHFPFETVWDIANVGIGLGSLGYNLYQGNYRDAAWDAGGLVLDVGATIIPYVPGGAATAIKAKRAANAIADVTLATARSSRRAVRHGDELAGLAPVSKHVLTEAMQGFRNKHFSVAGERFLLTKGNLENILSRHHPEYWGAAGTSLNRTLNTAFDGNLGIDEVANLAQQVAEKGYQGRTTRGGNIYYTAEIDGKWFELSVSGPSGDLPGQIVHFTPLVNAPK